MNGNDKKGIKLKHSYLYLEHVVKYEFGAFCVVGGQHDLPSSLQFVQIFQSRVDPLVTLKMERKKI